MRSTIIQGPIGPIHIQEASPSVTSGESEALPIAPTKHHKSRFIAKH
ncbi:hypothetical protein [Microcoleus sp.]